MKSWAWPHLWDDHMKEKPRDLIASCNQVPDLWSSLESIWKWCKAPKNGVVTLKLEKCCAEYVIFLPSLATEGAAHCYSSQPTPGWLWACHWKSLQTAGAFQINLAKPQQQRKQWGRIIPATKQADQRRKKLPIGDDEQVGRINWFISERNVNGAYNPLSNSWEGLQEQPPASC